MERWYSEKLAAFPALMTCPGAHIGKAMATAFMWENLQ
ncbi:hypothetical protein WM41_0360 [Corynebacterium simulans]|uniref:Uncharacterized protein n=1 Tax=Corynebacterium simulans TaxID=146827 RepID=A0ABR5VBG7_9CORY|nr:hypothetical protein WM41_0360 [Corynebacterium simulans]